MTDKKYARAQWPAATNIYEVNIRQYTPEGTFTAFAKELPRLKDMGVEVLWLMPIHPIGKKNRKGLLGSYYSIRDFKDVNPEFGTRDDFKTLVKIVHELGMKIIIDWVANHAAWDNVWTEEHPDYFERDADGNFKAPYDWTDVIQIDHTSIAEQDAMIAAMKFWVTDFDIDGFRADLAHLTPLSFWKKARAAIEPLKQNLFWLAETEEISYHAVFDASYTWEWMHKTEEFCKGKIQFNDLIDLLKMQEEQFPSNAYRMYFTSNHDENSWNGTEYEKYGGMAKAFAVFSFTWNGIPMIYSGQELPNLKRLKFFEKDTIAWKQEHLLHDFYKTLLGLRKRNPATAAGDTSVTTHLICTDRDKSILGYLRRKEADEILVFLNLSNQEIDVTITDSLINGSFSNVFDDSLSQLSAGSLLRIMPGGFLVFEKR